MIDEKKLGEDLLKATKAYSYGKEFKIRLLKRDEFNPFVVYLLARDKSWPVKVALHDYPMRRLPEATFVREVPPCPVHPLNPHPNIYTDQTICFGVTLCAKDLSITGFLNLLAQILRTANHASPANHSCDIL